MNPYNLSFKPYSIEAILTQQFHVFFYKAPEGVKVSLCTWHPWWFLHHHVDAMEVPLPLEAVHQTVCGGVDVETACCCILL